MIRRRISGAVLLVAVLLAIPSCKSDNPDVVNQIAEYKGDDWRSHLGEEVTLEAWLILDPEPALHFDLEDTRQNRATPESRYIRLAIPPNILRDLTPAYHGARVSVKGILAEDQTDQATSLAVLLGGSYPCYVDVTEGLQILAPSVTTYPQAYNICEANPSICSNLTITERQTYVMIYSGGINSSKAYKRYWNDMVFFHFTLTWILGVDASKIKVVYKNGIAENGYMPVDYAATISGVNAAFNWFDSQMNANDRFIFFATNHGGNGYDDTDNDEISGEDEAIFYYNEAVALTDDDLADKINALTFSQLIAILEPCYAGGLMYDLRGNNRIMVSASTEDQVSWGGLENYGNKYDHFVFYFTSALAGQYPDGTAVDADANNDGKVSMAEAFDYARVADTADEIPQIESDGNGMPSSTSAGESGTLAANTFIGN